METDPIRQELLGMLATWRTGKEVRVPELGHTQRMAPHPGEADRLDFSGLVSNDQQRVYDYVFTIIESALQLPAFETHEAFQDWCDHPIPLWLATLEDLTKEEREAAHSLIWKALKIGWRRAIAGHKDEQYVTIRRQKAVGSRQKVADAP